MKPRIILFIHIPLKFGEDTSFACKEREESRDRVREEFGVWSESKKVGRSKFIRLSSDHQLEKAGIISTNMKLQNAASTKLYAVVESLKKKLSTKYSEIDLKNISDHKVNDITKEVGKAAYDLMGGVDKITFGQVVAGNGKIKTDQSKHMMPVGINSEMWNKKT